MSIRFRSIHPALALGAGLLLLGGCGKSGKAVQTAPEPALPVETAVRTPVTPEAPVAPATDFTKLQPSEMGIEDVYFAYDQHALDDASMRTLSRNARILKEHPDVVVMIEGHCDERGTFEYNLALGEKRAQGVRDYLVNLGVGASQLRVTSYGETKPLEAGTGEAVWARNRRAHFARP